MSRRYTNIMLSVETKRLLDRIKTEAENLFEVSISYDKLVRWLVTSKVDWADLLALTVRGQ